MRLPFRADIEGLRAVAILLVVCAHANVPRLAGGFIGVDVFFVLSGYLITGLLVREFESTGHLDLVAFYARRLQRLMPGLLLVVLCTSLAGMVLLAPFEQGLQARAAGAAATWTSNFLFALSELDYFGPAAETNLFLHTWSLGVEEQFYLLWPALMLFLLGAWRWQGRDRNFRHLKLGLIAVAAICLALSIKLTYEAPQVAFYMVISRGWQFALGALVFLYWDQGHGRTASGWLYWTMGWAGLATILTSALILDSNSPYPGAWALLPSLGTAVVLIAGSGEHKKADVARVLATPPMQAIGRISYAWYLWHWPTLLLGLTLVDGQNPWYLLLLAALSLGLAIASYGLVEAPLRRSAFLRARPRTVLVSGILLMVAALVGSITWGNLSLRWSQTPQQVQLGKVRLDLPPIYAMGCDEWYHTGRVRACWFGPQDATHTAVLMGDSIAGQWYPAAAKLFNRPGWRLLVLTKSACPMVDRPFFYARIGREYTECAQWRNASIQYLQTVRPDLVLFSSGANKVYSYTDWVEGTSSVLSALADSAKRVAILAPPPMLKFDGPNCLARRQWRHWTIGENSRCSSSAADRHREMVRNALSTATQTHPGVEVLDLATAICPSATCSAERSGLVVYRDRQHLTAVFVETLASELGSALAVLDPDLLKVESPEVTQSVTEEDPK